MPWKPRHPMRPCRDSVEGRHYDTPTPLQSVPVGVQPLGPENDHVASLPASEQLRLDYASLPAMVWTLTAEGSCDHVNARWLEFTGRQAAAELGDGWADRMHPEDRLAALSQIQAAIAQRTPFQTEFRMRRHDGQYRWLLHVGAPRFGRDGAFLGVVGVATDVTDRRQLEQRLAPGRARASHRSAGRRHRARLQQPAHGHHRACRAAAGRAGAFGPGPGRPRADPALRRSRREPDPPAAGVQPPPGARAASAGPEPAGGRLPVDPQAAGGRAHPGRLGSGQPPGRHRGRPQPARARPHPAQPPTRATRCPMAAHSS